MRATGIVRRIDDLGRVVIPKEIRQKLRVREGEPLEIFIDDDSITFKKFEEVSLADELKEFYDSYASKMNTMIQSLLMSAIKLIEVEEKEEKETDENEE